MIEVLSSPSGKVNFTTVDGVQPYYHKYSQPICQLKYADSLYNSLHNGIDTYWKMENTVGKFSTVYSGRTPVMKFYYGPGVPEAMIGYITGRRWQIQYKTQFVAPVSANYKLYFGGEGSVYISTSMFAASTTLSLNMDAQNYSSVGPIALSSGNSYNLNVTYTSYKDNSDSGFIGLWNTDSASITPEKIPISGSIARAYTSSVLPSFKNIDWYSDVSYEEKEDGASQLSFIVPLITSADSYNSKGYYYDKGSDSFIAYNTHDYTLPIVASTESVWHFRGNLTDGNGAYNLSSVGALTYTTGRTEEGITSVKLDGTNGAKITAVDASDFNPGTESFTIEAYIKTTAAAILPIVSKASFAAGIYYGFRFDIRDTNVLRCYLGDNTGTTVTQNGTKVINDGLWHYVAMVVNRSTSKLYTYVDGVVDLNGGNISTIAGSIAGSVDLGIGYTGYGAFRGSIDEVCFTKKAFSSTEILSRYTGNPPRNLKKYRMVQYKEGYKSTNEEYITKFTGQIRDFNIKYSADGNDTLEVICNDYSVFTKDTINLMSPTPIDYWQAGYLVREPGRVNGYTKPRTFDGWELHKAYETILTDCGIDPYTFRNKKKYKNYSHTATSGGFYIEPISYNELVYLPTNAKYGIDPIGQVDNETSDDKYAFSIDTGEHYRDFIDKIAKSWYYNWGFSPEGYPYFKAINVPYKVYDDRDFSGSWTQNVYTSALKATYVSTATLNATAGCNVTGKKFVLAIGCGPLCGAVNPATKSLNVQVRTASEILVDTNYNAYYASNHFYYDGADANTGTNPSILNIANGLDYDKYRVIVKNLSASYTTKIDGILAYQEDNNIPCQTFYTSDTTLPGTITELGVGIDIDNQRTDCVVLGRRTGTVFRTNDKGEEETINVNNPTYTYIQSAARDLNSVYCSTATNYVGRPRMTVITDPSVISQEQADFIAFNVVSEYNRPKKPASFTIQGNPHLQVGDCIAVVDDYKKGISSTDYQWITSLTDKFDETYTTKIETTPVKPVDSYWNRPTVDINTNFGGHYIWNMKILNCGITGELSSGLGRSDYYLKCDISGIPATISPSDYTTYFADMVPYHGYVKVGAETIKYSSVTFHTDCIRAYGLTRNIPTGDTSTIVTYHPQRIGGHSGHKLETVIFGYLPYSNSSLPPIVEFDLLVNADVEVNIRNATDNFDWKLHSINSNVVDSLTKVEGDLSLDNYRPLTAGKYRFAWGGFDRFGDYNEAVRNKETEFMCLYNTQYYARENYKGTKCSNQNFDTAYGLFYSEINIIPKENNVGRKLYSSNSGDKYTANIEGKDGEIKQILIDPGVVDLKFSTSGLYYCTPQAPLAAMWSGNDAYWYYKRDRRNLSNSIGYWPDLQRATNYPMCVTSESDHGGIMHDYTINNGAIPVFLTNRSNSDRYGNSQGLLFKIEDKQPSKDKDIIRKYVPSLGFYFVQLGWYGGKDSNRFFDPIITPGVLNEGSDITLVNPGDTYRLNIHKFVEDKDVHFVPPTWQQEFVDNAKDNNSPMGITNYLFFDDRLVDLSGRQPQQVRFYCERYKPNTDDLFHVFAFQQGGGVIPDPDMAYMNFALNRLITINKQPYYFKVQFDTGTSSADSNRGFYEFYPKSGDPATWKWSYRGYTGDELTYEKTYGITFGKNLRSEKEYFESKMQDYDYIICNNLYGRNNYITWIDEDITREIRFYKRKMAGDLLFFDFALYLENAFAQKSNVFVPNIWAYFRRSDFV